MPLRSRIVAPKKAVGISLGLPSNLNYSPGAPGLKASFFPNLE